MDMAVLVEAQGDMINNIETHVRVLYFCCWDGDVIFFRAFELVFTCLWSGLS